jgi:hypothetical protein
MVSPILGTARNTVQYNKTLVVLLISVRRDQVNYLARDKGLQFKQRKLIGVRRQLLLEFILLCLCFSYIIYEIFGGNNDYFPYFTFTLLTLCLS